VSSEDVEDQLRAIKNAAGQSGLEVPELGRRQVVIEENQIGFGGRSDACDFFDFAGADQSGRIRLRPTLQQFCDDLAAGAQDQFTKFGERFLRSEIWQPTRAVS
jgi:hypothetical protein